MGFWQALGKMAQGKPVFETPTEPNTQDSTNQTAPPVSQDPNKTPVDGNGRKIIPAIRIEHCKTYRNGPRIDVRAWVTNASDAEIEIEKIEVMGDNVDVDRRLRPQQSHEVVLYKGPAPTNDYEHKANVHYKLVSSGDYFRADYRIEYNQESDGTYSVETLHPENYGVKDV
ncbi:MAG TPA: hypothetical protein VFM68_01465 [Candidatus Saccharimonadales bacterium]|nr:hypothetical protein [Candidatus Saccharimonadales bacterium]